MNRIFELSTTDLIALAAAVISLVSLAVAGFSLWQSIKANRISLLNDKEEVFREFVSLRSYMSQKGMNAEPQEVSKYYWLIKKSGIYFPGSIGSDVYNYYHACYKTSVFGRNSNEPESIERAREAYAQENLLGEKINKEISECLKY